MIDNSLNFQLLINKLIINLTNDIEMEVRYGHSQSKQPEPNHIFINTSSDTLASYIYKLHTSKGDVEQLLNESIHTTGVFCLIEDDSIVALITGILYEEDKYKVIGPFVSKDFTLTDNHFISLFSTLMESQSDHATFNFSYNDCAQDSKPLMKLIHANYNFTDYYLNVYKSLNEPESDFNIIEYQPGFQKLSVSYTNRHLDTTH